MAPRLSGQTSIFGVAFFVSKSLLGIERRKKLNTIFTRKPRSHVRILIYRTWPIRNRPLFFSGGGGREGVQATFMGMIFFSSPLAGHDFLGWVVACAIIFLSETGVDTKHLHDYFSSPGSNFTPLFGNS